MHMSKQNIYDMLISEYGEKFTAEQAQYAIDNYINENSANSVAQQKVTLEQNKKKYPVEKCKASSKKYTELIK